ncbi:MAG: inositol monophosphatase [Chloroflexota bacterium]|nr:inositol monophosphatase [Chloroflexota bacterium]
MTRMRAATEAALATAESAALAAGRLLLERWDGPVSGRSTKSSRTDEVSDADRASEALIVDAIRRAHPHDAIVSEEGGGATGTSSRRWLVDPLDGTVNYLYRIPHWCVTIACADAGGPLVGVTHDPVRGELFSAARGEGAWLRSSASASEPRRLAVSGVTDLGLSLLGDGFSYDAEDRREQARREALIVPVVRDVRRAGSAALDLAWVAAARLDAYAESGGREWDWAAGRLLVSEAGGMLSETKGVRPDAPTLVASGRGIHEALVALLIHVQDP